VPRLRRFRLRVANRPDRYSAKVSTGGRKSEGQRGIRRTSQKSAEISRKQTGGDRRRNARGARIHNPVAAARHRGTRIIFFQMEEKSLAAAGSRPASVSKICNRFVTTPEVEEIIACTRSIRLVARSLPSRLSALATLTRISVCQGLLSIIRDRSARQRARGFRWSCREIRSRIRLINHPRRQVEYGSLRDATSRRL